MKIYNCRLIPTRTNTEKSAPSDQWCSPAVLTTNSSFPTLTGALGSCSPHSPLISRYKKWPWRSIFHSSRSPRSSHEGVICLPAGTLTSRRRQMGRFQYCRPNTAVIRYPPPGGGGTETPPPAHHLLPRSFVILAIDRIMRVHCFTDDLLRLESKRQRHRWKQLANSTSVAR